MLRTDDGWWGFNIADGIKGMKPSSYRRDSRVEVTIEGDYFPDTDDLEPSLRECTISKA